MHQVQASFWGEGGVSGRATESQQMEPPIHVPIFLDRTFRMVEQGPADVVSWSRAGDSFIIKQVRLFEELLPSYYNHNKFMSFVRQLNFYGFQKVKGRASSRLSSGDDGGTQDVAAAAAEAKESESWAEFRHPQFRRGRRDLLVGITRQKDSGRLKRKQADARKSDIISTLATDVITVSGDLKAVSDKLDSITSLLLRIGSGKNRQAAPSNPIPQSQDNIIRDDGIAAAAAAGDGGGDVGFGRGAHGGTTASLAALGASAATARGGFDHRLVGGDSAASGGTRRDSLDPYERGTLFDYRPTSRLPADHHRRQQEWQGQAHPALYSQLPQHRPSHAERYPAVPNQARNDVVQPQALPSLGEVVEARASESTSVGPSRQQLPPLHLSPLTASEGKGNTSPERSAPSRGEGSGGGGGGGTSPSCASADGDSHDAQRQRQQQRERRGPPPHPLPPRQNREASNNVAGSHAGAGECVAVANRMQQGRLGVATSMI